MIFIEGKYMNKSILLLISLVVSGCASTPSLTRWNAPEMRVAVLGNEYLPTEWLEAVQGSLIETNRFHVVDRGTAMRAIFAEQDMTNTSHAERFDDSEKFAQLGKLLGVGGVIRVSSNCTWKYGWGGSSWEECRTALTLFSTSTGIAISSASVVQNKQDINWDLVVTKFNSTLPSRVLEEKWNSDMIAHKAKLAETAKARKVASVKEE